MVNLSLLEDKMKKKNISKEQLAAAIEVDKSTIYRKFAAGGEKFTIEEAKKITNALVLSPDEATKIFFSQTVA